MTPSADEVKVQPEEDKERVEEHAPVEQETEEEMKNATKPVEPVKPVEQNGPVEPQAAVKKVGTVCVQSYPCYVNMLSLEDTLGKI